MAVISLPVFANAVDGVEDMGSEDKYVNPVADHIHYWTVSDSLTQEQEGDRRATTDIDFGIEVESRVIFKKLKNTLHKNKFKATKSEHQICCLQRLYDVCD